MFQIDPFMKSTAFLPLLRSAHGTYNTANMDSLASYANQHGYVSKNVGLCKKACHSVILFGKLKTYIAHTNINMFEKHILQNLNKLICLRDYPRILVGFSSGQYLWKWISCPIILSQKVSSYWIVLSPLLNVFKLQWANVCCTCKYAHMFT